jgi:hypothetical protein
MTVTGLDRRTKAHAGSSLITTASSSFSGTGVGTAIGLNTTTAGTARNIAMTVVTSAVTIAEMITVTTAASRSGWSLGSSLEEAVAQDLDTPAAGNHGQPEDHSAKRRRGPMTLGHVSTLLRMI